MPAYDVQLEKARNHIYNPLDLVKGVVNLNITSQEKIHDVVVSFQGDMETIIFVGTGKNRHRCVERINMFVERKVLFQGPFTMQPQRLEFPFEFQFAENCVYDRPSDRNDGAGCFVVTARSALPPSLIHNCHMDDSSRNTHDSQNRCEIKYSITLSINDSKLFKNKTLETPLIFSPVLTRPPLPASSQSLLFAPASWQSRSLRPKEDRHTFKQKFLHAFTDDPELRNPSINFTAQLAVPDSLSHNKCLRPVTLSLRHSIRGPTDPERPTLRLLSLKLRIRGQLTWRCCRTLGRSPLETGKEDTAVVTFTPPKTQIISLDGSPMIITPDLTPNDFLPGMNFMVPDFQSYTVAMRHDIKAHLQIQHVESGHVFAMENSVEVQLYPPERRALSPLPSRLLDQDPTVPAYVAEPWESGLPLLSMNDRGDESLPTYEAKHPAIVDRKVV